MDRIDLRRSGRSRHRRAPQTGAPAAGGRADRAAGERANRGAIAPGRASSSRGAGAAARWRADRTLGTRAIRGSTAPGRASIARCAAAAAERRGNRGSTERRGGAFGARGRRFRALRQGAPRMAAPRLEAVPKGVQPLPHLRVPTAPVPDPGRYRLGVARTRGDSPSGDRKAGGQAGRAGQAPLSARLLPALRDRVLPSAGHHGRARRNAGSTRRPSHRRQRRRRGCLPVSLRGSALAPDRWSRTARTLAGLPQGNRRPRRGAGASQCPQGRSGTDLRGRRGTGGFGRRGRAGRVDPTQLPVLPGAVVPGRLHQKPTLRTLQAGNARSRQPEHRHHDPCGAGAHRGAGRPGTEPRSAQAPELHRQPSGRFAAGRPLQRLCAGRPAAIGRSRRDCATANCRVPCSTR